MQLSALCAAALHLQLRCVFFGCNSTAIGHCVRWRGVPQNCAQSISMVPRGLVFLGLLLQTSVQAVQHAAVHQPRTCVSRTVEAKRVPLARSMSSSFQDEPREVSGTLPGISAVSGTPS